MMPQPLIPKLHEQVVKDRVWAAENDKGHETEYIFDY